MIVTKPIPNFVTRSSTSLLHELFCLVCHHFLLTIMEARWLARKTKVYLVQTELDHFLSSNGSTLICCNVDRVLGRVACVVVCTFYSFLRLKMIRQTAWISCFAVRRIDHHFYCISIAGDKRGGVQCAILHAPATAQAQQRRAAARGREMVASHWWVPEKGTWQPKAMLPTAK